MKLTYLVLALGIAPIMTGCSSTPDKVDPNYAMFVTAQKDIALNKPQTPLFRIKAQPGQQIKMDGVDELVVFAPESNQQKSVVQQYVAPRSEAAEVAKAALNVIGSVGGVIAVGNATTNLAKAVGSASNHGYQYVQAPQANMSIGGDGVIGDGSFTSTSNSLTGTGAVGGAYTDSHNVSTTTTTTTSDLITPVVP
jgi:hypothetical protein